MYNINDISKMNGEQLISLFSNSENTFNLQDIKTIVKNASAKVENVSESTTSSL